MPYKRQGALKISDHQVRSPLLNINRACQTCHRWPENALKDRVEQIQVRFFNEKNVAMDALMELTNDISAAKAAGTGDKELAVARDFQRKAGFCLDFVMSDNSMGFHAPQEEERVLAEVINLCRQGQLSLRPPANLQRAAVSASSPGQGIRGTNVNSRYWNQR